VETLVATEIVKAYGGVRALRGVDLGLYPGEVHGLVGENGSGKSTLLKVISGQVQPQAGRLVLGGQETRFADSHHAVGAGVVAVTQETTLVPGLSVAENIMLGPRKPRTWRGIDWRATKREARAALERLHLDLDLDLPVGGLRPDQQQMVEIARAISMRARVLILDEPTSSLDDDEAEALFAVVRGLKLDGLAIVFVSHRMSELFSVVDRITILRDGSVVESGPIGDYDRDRLVQLMTGRAVRDAVAAPTTVATHDVPLLEVRGLSVPGRLAKVDLTVPQGAIVGLAGLVGAGRTELMRALFGLEPHATGSVRLAGRSVSLTSPSAAMREGVAFVPGDRKQLGLVLDMTVRENLLMARSALESRLRRPPVAAERRVVDAAVADFRVRLESAATQVWRLSGGNQQKVVLAKWLATDPRLLMLDEPTRGVDIGAKADIYQLLRGLRDSGLTILVSSSETPELLALCDRILVLHRGAVAGTLDARRANEALVTQMAMGHGTEAT
jgi:ABC-type sugar transport system ATPase subunit